MTEATVTESQIMPAGPDAIARAVDLLRRGAAIGLPTETVYGLAADATNDKAVARIYEVKGRPSFNPLIAHVASPGMAHDLVEFPPLAERLAEAFWPGPLTLVLKRTKTCPVSLLASAGLDTLAVRMPAHPVARQILTAFGGALVAPSANPSGRVSPTTARHVAQDLAVDLVIDGGPCTVGLESTVVSVTDDQVRLLRAGGITVVEIERCIGTRIETEINPDRVSAPGQLESHYAPAARLRLNAVDVGPDEALLAFGSELPGARSTRNLSPGGDLIEAAANLFAMLRDLDASGAATIAVMPIPEDGLGAAINDRLRRAAAPRGEQV